MNISFIYTSMQWTLNRNYSNKSCGFPHYFFPKLTPPPKKTTVFPTQTPSCTWRSSKVWKPKSHQVIKKSTVFQATTWVVGETSFQQPIPLAICCCCSGVPQLQGDSFGSWKHHQWGPIRICAWKNPNMFWKPCHCIYILPIGSMVYVQYIYLHWSHEKSYGAGIFIDIDPMKINHSCR